MNAGWTPTELWLLRCAGGGGVLLLLAWVLSFVPRQPGRRQRLGEWGLAAALVHAGLSLGPAWLRLPWPASEPERPVMQTLPVEPPVNALAIDDTTESVPDEAPAVFIPLQAIPNAEPFPSSEPAAPVTAAGWPLFLVGIYAAGAVFLLGRWLLGCVALARLLRACRPPPEFAARLFGEMARGQRPAPRLLASRKLRVPVSCGLLRPTVIVPADWCRSRTADTLRWVFAHELTHLRRRDGWSCLLFGIGQAVYFYLPWFWWLRRRVRLCQEYVADAAAAELPAPVEEYADFLLTLTATPAVPLGATGVGGHSSDLFRRVVMLLQTPVHVEKRCPRWWSMAVAGGLLALAVCLAGVGPAAAEPETPPPPVREPARAVPAAPAEKQLADAKEMLRQHIHRLQEELKKLEADGQREQEQKHLKQALQALQMQLQTVRDQPAVVVRGEDPWKVNRLAAPDNRLGIQVEWPSVVLAEQLDLPKHTGLVITHVRPGSPAEKAGLKVNDILLELAGKSVQRHDNLFAKLLDEIKAETPVEAKVLRKGKRETVQGLALPVVSAAPVVRLERMTRPTGGLGVRVEKPGDLLAEQLGLAKGQGLVVQEVQTGSAAEKAGVKVNDILVELAGKPVVSDPAKLQAQVQGLKADTPVDLVVLRKGQKETLKGLTLSAAKVIWSQPNVEIDVLMPRFQAVAAPAVALPAAQPGSVVTTTVRTSDRVTTRYQEGNLVITLTGKVADGQAKVGDVHIQDAGVATKYDSVEKVPEQYRDKVKSLIEMTEKSSVKIDVKVR